MPAFHLIDYFILLAIAVFSIFGLRAEFRDVRSGKHYACCGDCSKCKIKCRSSEKYYGKPVKK